MKISYANSRIRKICTDDQFAQKVLGRKWVEVLGERIFQIRRAETLAQLRLSPGHWHELTGDRKRRIARSLLGRVRLIFTPKEPVPLKPDGGMDWSKITSIVNLEIIDYH